jgi:hypothetical protein
MSDEDGDGILDTHGVSEWGDGINWMANSIASDPDPWLMLDLYRAQELGLMKVWNFNGVGPDGSLLTDRGVGLVDLYVSDLADPGSDFSDDAIWTLLQEGLQLTPAPGTAGYDTPDEIDLGGVSARWLAFDIQGSLGHPSFVGLAEVQVFGPSDIIPEPATLSLLALGALGLLARRRRRR